MNLTDHLKKISIKLTPWRGGQIKNDYNGKAVLDYNGQPLFGELAVLKQYNRDGYDGVWIDNYGKKYRQNLPEIDNGVDLPESINKRMNDIYENKIKDKIDEVFLA